MIPKKIHYCWFGRGEKPKLAQKCIASWKKYMPDYEIIEWNEDNIDINMNAYTKMCYDTKKYAFLSDYIRLIVVEQHGGIYFDTDVEVIKPFDELLIQESFFGFENPQYVASGLGFGAEAHNSAVSQMIKEYEPYLDGKHGTAMCPALNTSALLEFDLSLNGKTQQLSCATVYAPEYFNPMNSATGKITVTDQTYSIHRYSMSWISPARRLRTRITRIIHRVFGENSLAFLRK